MRLALISDTHGNLPALEAVLRDAERREVDGFFCLGDIASLGPHPVEVTRRIRELGCACVKGNHDAWTSELAPERPDELQAGLLWDFDAWARERLGEDDLAFLRGLPMTAAIEVGQGVTVLGFHGSPASYDEMLGSHSPPAELAAAFAGFEAAVFAGGHTHEPFLRPVGRSVFVNPGTIGLSEDRLAPLTGGVLAPWATYAVLDADGGSASLSFMRVDYDLEATIAAARERGLPHVEEWIGPWPEA